MVPNITGPPSTTPHPQTQSLSSLRRTSLAPSRHPRQAHRGSNLAIKCATYRWSNDGRKSSAYEALNSSREPHRYQADEDLVARFICHVNSTHVLQSLALSRSW